MSKIIVPFNDLYAQYQSLKLEIDTVINEVIANSNFVRGPYVDKFEEDFASTIGTKHCVSCANGTDAIFLALKALGIKPGDEVIAPAHSWISTTSTITQSGGKVIFCDTTKDTFTIDSDLIESKITSKTVGIIPVHLFGQSADMDPIMALARKHNLWVIEDCAQAHLAKYKGRTVGTFGDIATFSFYPGKNLGAMGDAGAALTNQDDLAIKMAMTARHGGLVKGDHLIEGVNSRMDGMQAAILSVKLPYLANWTKARQEIAYKYSKEIKNSVIQLPKSCEWSDHVYHLYVIKSNERELLSDHLSKHNVQTVINYPVALPFLPAYKRYNHSVEDFPNAYSNQHEILSLPIFPEMSTDQINKVIELVTHFNLP